MAASALRQIEDPAAATCGSVPEKETGRDIRSIAAGMVRNDDEKLIGVYATKADAVAEKRR